MAGCTDGLNNLVQLPDKKRRVAKECRCAKFFANGIPSMVFALNPRTKSSSRVADWAYSEYHRGTAFYHFSLRCWNWAVHLLRPCLSAAAHCGQRYASVSAANQHCWVRPPKWRSRWAHEKNCCFDCDASGCDSYANVHCCDRDGAGGLFLHHMCRYVDLQENIESHTISGFQLQIGNVCVCVWLTCVGLFSGGDGSLRSLQWTKKCPENGAIKYDAGQNEQRSAPFISFDEKIEQRCKYECAESGSAHRNARCQWTILIEISCHTDNGRQVDQPQTESRANTNREYQC